MKFKIGSTEYNFKMTNRTILKIDEKYNNYGIVLNGIMKGEAIFTSSLKLMICSSLDANFNFTIDELAEVMTNEQMQLVPTFGIDLYLDYIKVAETTETKKD